jgi:signal transduction histidine kinase/CHASE3 domain sensor protein
MSRTYVRIFFLGILVVLISVALLTFSNLNNYTEEVKLIRHSNRVLTAIQTVMFSVRDAETGHRGYQLTRDTTYLEPYYSSLRSLPDQISILDSLLSDDEIQSLRADTLENKIEDQFAIISQILSNARRSSLYMDRYESSLLAHGKENMSQIRKLAQDITDHEEAKFRGLISNETDFRTTAPIALLLYTLVALAAVTFLFTRVLDSLRSRDLAEERLRESIQNLRKEGLAREERELVLSEAETLANMGSWKWYESTGTIVWSNGLYPIFNKPQTEQPTWDSFLDYVHPEDKQAVHEFFDEVKLRKSRMEITYRIDVNGRFRYLMIVARPKENPGTHQVDILGIVLDLTEQKAYEAQLQQFTAELQRSNQDLEQFAYVASHDLQEPLRKIRAFGDRLTAKYQSILEEQGSDYVSRMQSAAARMQVLIEELLSFSRVSRPGMLTETLDVNEIVSEIREDLETQIRREGATLVSGNLPSVRGERSQIKRLLQNLISNSVKFHKNGKGSRVEIKGTIVRGGDAQNEFNVPLPKQKYARIEVKDDGIGFDEKYLEKIFTIFQRLHGRAEYEGTGIGLAICRKIVVNHGGFITARSEENKGSTFIVILPID